MITNALLSLMNVYAYNDITITQICQEAKVVRQTFYRNFETKIDILELCFDNMFEKFQSDYLDTESDMYKILKVFFDYSLLNKDFFKLIEKNDLFFLLNKTINTNMFKFSYIPKTVDTIKDPKLDVYVSGFISSTICSILSLWIKNDFKETTEMLANLTKTFFWGLKNPIDLGLKKKSE